MAAFRVREALKKAGINTSDVSTSVLSEIHAIPAKDLRAFGERLVSGGGTLACARQLVREYNASKKKPSAPPKATEDAEPDISMNGGDIDPLAESATTGDGEAGEEELSEAAPKTPPAKQTSTQPPARVLEEPPRKNVDLNSVQKVIQTYIDKVGDLESGYSYEYKTNAAYEIWSLLLAELAGL